MYKRIVRYFIEGTIIMVFITVIGFHKLFNFKISKKWNMKTTESNIPEWSAWDFDSISYLYSDSEVDCKGVLENNSMALNQAFKTYTLPERQGIKLPDEFYIEKTKNCAGFIKDRGYITSSLSQLEEDFPLAYSIVAYKETEAVERLLRAVYRPQNVYCIHVDAKSSDAFYAAVSGVAACFSNVFMAPKRIDVKYGMFPVLETDLMCMRKLYEEKANWRYFINLTGKVYFINHSDIFLYRL